MQTIGITKIIFQDISKKINSLYHNAGVTDNTKQFFKGDYIYQLPYNSELTLSPHYASIHYYELVKEIGRNINCQIILSYLLQK